MMLTVFLVAQIVLPAWAELNGARFYADGSYHGLSHFYVADHLQDSPPIELEHSISSIELFGGAKSIVWADHGMRGKCLEINSDHADMPAGWNDVIGSWSVHVFDGVCLFADYNYEGDHLCVPAGTELSTLPSSWNDRISSVQVRGLGEYVAYKNTNFQGASYHSQTSSNMPADFNDVISSVKVSARDGACFYADPGYTGSYFCLEPNHSLSMPDMPINDRISSIRISGQAQAHVWLDKNYTGKDKIIFNNAFLGDPWNDAISSVSVLPYEGSVPRACPFPPA